MPEPMSSERSARGRWGGGLRVPGARGLVHGHRAPVFRLNSGTAPTSIPPSPGTGSGTSGSGGWPDRRSRSRRAERVGATETRSDGWTSEAVRMVDSVLINAARGSAARSGRRAPDTQRERAPSPAPRRSGDGDPDRKDPIQPTCTSAHRRTYPPAPDSTAEDEEGQQEEVSQVEPMKKMSTRRTTRRSW